MVNNSINVNKTNTHLNSLNTKIPYVVGNPGTILEQAYKYGGVKSINGIPTLLSSVLNVRGLKIEILHVISSFLIKGWGEGGRIFESTDIHSLWFWWGPCCYF